MAGQRTGRGQEPPAAGIDSTMLEAALGALRNALAYMLPVRLANGRVADFRLTWANPAYVSRFAPSDDAIGRLVSEVMPPLWRESLFPSYLEAFEQQHQFSIERSGDLKGRTFDYLFNLLPTAAGLAVSVDDRTKRKLAEQELALTTSLLRGITRLQERFLADEPISVVFEAVTALAIETTGSKCGYVGELVHERDTSELRIQAMSDLRWSDEQREHYRKLLADGARFAQLDTLWARVLRTGEPLVMNDLSNEPDLIGEPGNRFELQSFLALPIRRHSRLLGMIGLVNRAGGFDSSWVERLEPLVTASGALLEAANEMRARRHIEAQLRRSEELLREAQEIAALGAYSYELPSGHARWTAQTHVLMGVPLDRPPLTIDEALERVSPEYLAPLRELFQSIIVDGEQRDLDARFLVNGSERHMQVVLRGRFGPDGRVVEVHGTVKDITERKEVEEARIRFEQQLAETQRLEALGLLAGGIAHDVNNLLVGVLANASMIRQEVAADHMHAEAAGEIELAARRMAELARQVLDYAGRSRSAPQPLDLNPLVAETVQLVRRTLPRNARIDVRLASGQITVEGDAAQLRQVVMNLVINAGDALSGSQGEVVVQTSVDRTKEASPRAVLVVTDTGVGMNDEVRRRIFDPFFTTKQKGRGLGLSAVHGIVRRFGGTIEVDSVPLRGATFRVSLPITARDATPVRGVPIMPTRLRRLRVLVVDDEPSVRNAVQRMLERLHCEVAIADGGREALHHFSTAPVRFDVVLLDVLMPYLSGADVLREVRRVAPQQRIVMMSGFTGQDEHATLNADGFLRKPFTSDELESLLAAVTAAGDVKAG